MMPSPQKPAAAKNEVFELLLTSVPALVDNSEKNAEESEFMPIEVVSKEKLKAKKELLLAESSESAEPSELSSEKEAPLRFVADDSPLPRESADETPALLLSFELLRPDVLSPNEKLLILPTGREMDSP